MNKPRTAPNKNKRWTCRNGEAAILKILEESGIDLPHDQKMRISAILDRVAEHYGFEEKNAKDESETEI